MVSVLFPIVSILQHVLHQLLAIRLVFETEVVYSCQYE